jgi:hypothetical protein
MEDILYKEFQGQTPNFESGLPKWSDPENKPA